MRTILILPMLAVLSTPAMAIYKCESAGKISYSDSPCSNSKGIKFEEPLEHRPSARDITDAKLKAAREKAELERIESKRSKREAKEEKDREKIARAGADKRKKCDEMALQKKWADEDAASATGKSAQKARRTARRKAEKLEMECGN
jgi:hypothetical protein